MALYLGGEKLKLNFSGDTYNLLVSFPFPTTVGVMLLSLDNYILKDSNGVYITAKGDK